jgi:hypothetical protein
MPVGVDLHRLTPRQNRPEEAGFPGEDLNGCFFAGLPRTGRNAESGYRCP